MKTDVHPVRSARLLADATRSIFRPPFRTIVALSVLIEIVSSTFAGTLSDGALMTIAILVSIDVLLQLALTLAGASPDPEPTADGWIKGAFRRRCFLRYLLTELSVALVVVLAGIGGLIVGGVIAAGWLSLAQPAAALERRMPVDAMRRSLELARGSVTPLAIVFALTVLLPATLAQVGVYLGWDKDLGAVWTVLTSIAVVVGSVGAIALARAFVLLGGEPTPSLDRIDPRAAG